MRILLDCDGVMANFVGGYLDVAHAVTGKRYTLEDVTQWNMAEALGLSKVEADAVHAGVESEGFCRNLGVYPGVSEAIPQLRERADVYVVTSPWHSEYWHAERVKWLEEELGFDKDHVIFAAHKDFIDGDVFVDDRVKHVIAWQEAHPEGLAVLWVTGTVTQKSQFNLLPPSVFRTNSWTALIRRIDAELPAEPQDGEIMGDEAWQEWNLQGVPEYTGIAPEHACLLFLDVIAEARRTEESARRVQRLAGESDRPLSKEQQAPWNAQKRLEHYLPRVNPYRLHLDRKGLFDPALRIDMARLYVLEFCLLDLVPFTHETLAQAERLLNGDYDAYLMQGQLPPDVAFVAEVEE